MLENTDGNNHSPKITPTTPAFGSEPARERGWARPTQGDEKRFLFSGSPPSPLSSRPERSAVEGPAVRRLFLGNVFRQRNHGPSATQGDEKPLLFSNYPFWKRHPPLCHLDRSEPGFPTSRCWRRPRVRLSVERAACRSSKPRLSTGIRVRSGRDDKGEGNDGPGQRVKERVL